MAEAVRRIGEVRDDDADLIQVGVDHGTVTFRTGTAGVRLSPRQSTELHALWVAATVEAGKYRDAADD